MLKCERFSSSLFFFFCQIPSMQWVGEITEQHLPQKRLLRSLSVTRKSSVVLSQDIAVFKTIALQVSSSLPSHYQQKKTSRQKFRPPNKSNLSQ